MEFFSFRMPRASTIRLLVAGTSAGTAELLRFAATRVGNQEGPIEFHVGLLNHLFCSLIPIFLVIRDERLRYGLPDRVNLRRVATPLHPHADVEVLEIPLPNDKDSLIHLVAEDGGLQQLEGISVDFYQAVADFAVGHATALRFRPKHWTERNCTRAASSPAGACSGSWWTSSFSSISRYLRFTRYKNKRKTRP